MTRPLGNVGTNWTPRVHDYYPRQRENQRGAWQRTSRTYQGATFAGADTETKIDSLVAAVTHSFREHGTKAGLQEAAKLGMLSGARLYIEIRAESEEQLSARLARIRSDLALSPENTGATVARAFVEVRLREVRAAVVSGQTPPQAIADRPEIPRREVRRWVPYVALAVGIIALARSLGR